MVRVRSQGRGFHPRRAVDGHERVDNQRMRCDPRLHRDFAHFDLFGVLVNGSRHPTRTQAGDVQRHDDGSCLEDLVAAGLVRAWWRVRDPERPFGGGQAKIELTGKGLRIAAALRTHKARGGHFSDFDPAPVSAGTGGETS